MRRLTLLLALVLLLVSGLAVGAATGTGYQLRRHTVASGQISTTSGNHRIGGSITPFNTNSSDVTARNGYWIATEDGNPPPASNATTVYLPLITR